MILSSAIRECVHQQRKYISSKPIGLERNLLFNIRLRKEYVLIITGVRRCGKSTLMQQLSGGFHEEIGYLNFEDPRIFGFNLNDFTKLEEAFGECSTYFFDEIQVVENWELFIRNLHDRGKTIVITGSNASLLSKELGTKLTGRNVQLELFPFCFVEFTKFLNLDISEQSFQNYLKKGGFPDFLKTNDIPYLQQLFRDILYRDIAVRYSIRNVKILEELALFLLSNVGKEYSLNKLKKVFGIGSANSVGDYIRWFEDSYLIFTVPKFSWSLKSVAINPKKIYAIDTGLASANSLSVSADHGRLLENAVFLELRREGKEIYYFKERRECDFIVKNGTVISEVIQVCWDLNHDNQEREINGLWEAMDYLNLKSGIIITMNQSDTFRREDKLINVVPGFRWFNKKRLE